MTGLQLIEKKSEDNFIFRLGLLYIPQKLYESQILTMDADEFKNNSVSFRALDIFTGSVS